MPSSLDLPVAELCVYCICLCDALYAIQPNSNNCSAILLV